jgi:glycoprotein endo-alpha-1,2-mannosidase
MRFRTSVILLAMAWCAAAQPPAGSNLALNKPATGSTPCNDDENPAKAVNGSVSGGTGDKWCSSEDSKWLQVDLGANFKVDRMVVRHSAAGGEDEAWNTRAFKIHVSVDGRKFTTVVNVTANTADTTTHKIEPVTARYVQLEVITPTQDGDPAARIYEFEVYGQAIK